MHGDEGILLAVAAGIDVVQPRHVREADPATAEIRNIAHQFPVRLHLHRGDRKRNGVAERRAQTGNLEQIILHDEVEDSLLRRDSSSTP